MKRRRIDRLAMLGIALAVLVVCWPLRVRIHHLPPPDEEYGLDLLKYYSSAAAARTTVFRFGQFPLRSPWHGGGYPLYAYPEDMTLSPTFLLILLLGPWAALKVEFVLMCILAGTGMFLLTRRKMGYSLVAAVFSATAFALGGYLMTKWLLGWLATVHAVWLPWMMYALWRGRERRRWLAFAALIVAWLILDHKYVAMVMGGFLFFLGLVRLDGERPGRGGLPWGYFGRLIGVWAFGVALAAVKLVPLWPLLRDHVRNLPPNPWADVWWQPTVVWLVILVSLGLMPLIARLWGAARTRVAAAGWTLALLAALAAAAMFCAPQGAHFPRRSGRWIREAIEDIAAVGWWEANAFDEWTPFNHDRYRRRAPVGPIVCVLALVGVAARPRKTWKWAILAALLLACELGPALPRNLGESWSHLPLVYVIRRPREHLNFYLFFLMVLLAGRALDWPAPAPTHRRRRRVALVVLAVASWGLLAANVLATGRHTARRLAYSVRDPLPDAPEWREAYQLVDRLERPMDEWDHNLCLLLRQNIGLKDWDIDFEDTRHMALLPNLRVGPGGNLKDHPDSKPMAWFEPPVSTVHGWRLTPNRIAVDVRLSAPGVLVINQIGDPDWRPSHGEIVRGEPLLKIRLSEADVAESPYTIHLRYVPGRLYVGVGVSVLVALVGLGVLVLLWRRRAA